MNGRGRNQGYGLGAGGTCICPNCEYETPHGRGDPCYSKTCPKCDTKMTRKV